jgi:hypothetical protein
MIKKKLMYINLRTLLILLVLAIGFKAGAQQSQVFGKVSDVSGNPLDLINVIVKGEPKGTYTLEDGSYALILPANKPMTLVFSSVMHKKIEREIILKQGQKLEVNVRLDAESEQLVQVDIEDKQVRKSTLTRLDPKIMNVIPEASGNLEAMIKTLPGVSSNNELSSQYSVRGGNYDENLVYVNGIQVYRPFLVRSGQQEGMSFINSDMVSSVLFSSGGFDAKYGDKMSSALDIKYIKPTEWGGSVSASLLGASLMLQGDNKNHRFKHISGLRYKSTKYVLNSLETEGEYDPQFIDFQTYMSYEFNDKLEVSFLGNYAQNSYKLVPQDRVTSFGTANQALQLKMYFDGQEVDQFNTYTGAVSFDYKHSDQLKLSLITSAFNTVESETFDIQTQYWINQVDNDLSSESLGDSVANLGVGTFLEHARNYLSARVYSIEHKGLWVSDKNFFQWGIKGQQEHIEDNLREWTMNDSSGYSRPYTDSIVSVYSFFKAKNNINSIRLSAFLQNTFTHEIASGELSFTAGIRGAYWDFNEEFLLSPRGNIAFKPNWEKDVVFKFSSGYYYQPAFYKEMRSSTGVINPEIKAQKSLHFVLGSDYNFKAWNRPFKLVAEAYYKKLSDLVSYSVDNVRIIYSGTNDAVGYAMGIDVKVNGEFVKGVDSWFSLSVMKTEEDIIGDVHQYTDADGNEVVEYPGYIPRPSDQRVNMSVFFQDYFPGNPDYKMHMQINYGTGLPFGPPDSPRYMATARMKSYQRVDLGFSKILKSNTKEYPRTHFLHFVKEAWISAEVFNLMDRQNTISHEWVSDYNNRQYAVENSLTGRRLNVKLNIQF